MNTVPCRMKLAEDDDSNDEGGWDADGDAPTLGELPVLPQVEEAHKPPWQHSGGCCAMSWDVVCMARPHELCTKYSEHVKGEDCLSAKNCPCSHGYRCMAYEHPASVQVAQTGRWAQPRAAQTPAPGIKAPRLQSLFLRCPTWAEQALRAPSAARRLQTWTRRLQGRPGISLRLLLARKHLDACPALKPNSSRARLSSACACMSWSVDDWKLSRHACIAQH